MDRISGANYATVNGKRVFQDVNLTTGTNGTTANALFLTGVQESIIGAVEAAGLTATDSDNTQLTTAIKDFVNALLVSSNIWTKQQNLAGGGVVVGPPNGDNTNKIANSAFVTAAIAAFLAAENAWPQPQIFNGGAQTTTQAPADNSGNVATTAFVKNGFTSGFGGGGATNATIQSIFWRRSPDGFIQQGAYLVSPTAGQVGVTWAIPFTSRLVRFGCSINDSGPTTANNIAFFNQTLNGLNAALGGPYDCFLWADGF